jgi:hypothetical protein
MRLTNFDDFMGAKHCKTLNASCHHLEFTLSPSNYTIPITAEFCLLHTLQ